MFYFRAFRIAYSTSKLPDAAYVYVLEFYSHKLGRLGPGVFSKQHAEPRDPYQVDPSAEFHAQQRSYHKTIYTGATE